MNIQAVFPWLTTSIIKAVVIAVLVWIAHKWSKGDLDGKIKNLKQLGKEYGIITISLIVIWWILTPSGLPDDLVAVWIISQLGMIPYIIILGSLTVYLVWRLRVTIVIYKK